ncbi:MAG TPA: hypothetical protein VHC67_18330 [Gaiellaceae bacterium]|nr:hypothetical protein [Gaiellaceae bacterium]
MAPPRDVWEALQRCLELPRRWVVPIAVLALVSTVHVGRKEGSWEFAFGVGSITATLVALAWLPALLSVIALTGGKIKTSAGEASTGGLLDFFKSLPPGEREAPLAALAAAAENVEATGPVARRPQARRVRQEAEEAIASAAGGPHQVEERLTELAQRYDNLRAHTPPGPDRTRAMTQIAAAARGYARATTVTAARWFDSGGEGARIVGLAAIQAAPSPRDLDRVVDAISHSKSAFEQFQALRSADALAPGLDAAGRTALCRAISGQIAEVETSEKRITPADQSRWAYAHDLLRRYCKDQPPAAT